MLALHKTGEQSIMDGQIDESEFVITDLLLNSETHCSEQQEWYLWRETQDNLFHCTYYVNLISLA